MIKALPNFLRNKSLRLFSVLRKSQLLKICLFQSSNTRLVRKFQIMERIFPRLLFRVMDDKGWKVLSVLTCVCPHWLQESACVKVVAAVSMWDVCMERGHRDLEQFERVHRYISDQLFTNFVSNFFFKSWPPSQGHLKCISSCKSQFHRRRPWAPGILVILQLYSYWGLIFTT